jgi:menaquinone-9 beta-reductase
LERYDVVVVGGGPAGAVCAWRLAGAGVRTVLVDRSRFPRRKACGGALGGSGAKLLESSGMLAPSSLSALAICEHFSMQCFWKLNPLRTFASSGPPITLVDRGSFDAALVDRARDAGAEIIEGDGFFGLGSGTLCLRSGRELAFGSLVGADGADSSVARSAFRRRLRRQGFGLEFFLPAPAGLPHILQIHFGLEPYGYGWVFPSGPDVCVGLGRCDGRTAPAALLSGLMRFVESLGLGRPDPSGLRAAPLPSGRPSASLGAGDVYLAGDAAGLVDRVSGEGLCLAIESGLLVADSISGGWSRDRLRRAASAGCAGRVRDSALARHLLHFPVLRSMAMRRLARKDKFYEGYWKLVSGETGYRGMLREFLRTP